MIEQSQTNAAIFLTVYPTSLDLSDDDWSQLTDQINSCRSSSHLFFSLSYRPQQLIGCVIADVEKQRTVFLRFAPEMQGTWNAASVEPFAFSVDITLSSNLLQLRLPARRLPAALERDVLQSEERRPRRDHCLGT